jgi:hypothetical protein
MNANSIFCHEDDLGYDCPDQRRTELLSERVAITAARKTTGKERVAQQSRFSRRPAPQRTSGAHRRGNKRYGI